MGAINSHPVAGERYRLSPHGSNPRYFLRSFAWSARIQAMAARSGTRAQEPGLSHYDPGFSRKIQNPTGSTSITYPPIHTNRRAFTLSRAISFTRVVPEGSAIGQRLATG
jgi:hypothetical protein